MKEKLAAWGALGSAFLASVCCIGPLILVALGLGGVGLAAGIAQYRPFFLALTFALLGMAFYRIYRKREVRCADGSCEIRSGRRSTKILLWGITVAALGLASSHLWIRAFASKAPAAVEGEQITLQVTGMHCEACAVSIEKALQKVPWVKAAIVDFGKSEAQVIVDPRGISPETLVKVVEETGYKAAPSLARRINGAN